MAPFEELQELWQRQTVWRIGRADAASLARDFRRFGCRQDLINFVKLVAVAGQFVFLFVRLRDDPLRLFGAALADFGAVFFVLHEWRTQRAVARLEFGARSLDFVRSTIIRLEALRNPFRGVAFWILMGAFWIGTNLMMLGRRWIWHVILTLAPPGMYFLGVYLRAKRWNLQCRPLVDRLTALMQAAEERSA
jgi:hypothetical protein